MHPILMRLLGANWPNTVAGTIAGNPTAAAAPSPVFKKPRREIPLARAWLMSLPPEEFYAFKVLRRQPWILTRPPTPRGALFQHFVFIATNLSTSDNSDKFAQKVENDRYLPFWIYFYHSDHV
jgi:hypothetical protein